MARNEKVNIAVTYVTVNMSINIFFIFMPEQLSFPRMVGPID
jgi:hypothetical protein